MIRLIMYKNTKVYMNMLITIEASTAKLKVFHKLHTKFHIIYDFTDC